MVVLVDLAPAYLRGRAGAWKTAPTTPLTGATVGILLVGLMWLVERSPLDWLHLHAACPDHAYVLVFAAVYGAYLVPPQATPERRRHPNARISISTAATSLVVAVCGFLLLQRALPVRYLHLFFLDELPGLTEYLLPSVLLGFVTTKIFSTEPANLSLLVGFVPVFAAAERGFLDVTG